jgi:choice-of-anchor C domain-containing protein
MRKLILAAALAAPMFASAADNLILNGGFEDFTGTFNAGHYSTVYANETSLANWTVGGATVDVVKDGYWGAISGNSIDMLGTPGPGTLSQTFNTVLGQSYLLSFDLSANMGGGDSKALFVSFNGGAATSFTGSGTISPYSLSFVGTGSPTTLLFASAATGNSGAVLDNVSVAAVPEPESYAMLLAGLGLMGAIARRRNKKQA